MSKLPSSQEQKLLAQAVERARVEAALKEKNKQAAREALLRIQLALASRTN